MNSLPSSVEAYLTDAGFTGTEITVLKKLLEGDALTLRELASKTGKSTGVLDLGVKKLLSRSIIVRETVNDVPKLVLKSLEAILTWVKSDTEEKLRAMKSRAQDFETFIASLERENIRPEMEYFEGKDGTQKAYEKLLSLGVKEFLHYLPVTCKEEEDPLAAFYVQYFRERHKRKIFSRVLAPETSLGRRYQSRDAFEYRQTQLISESVFPITFEKVIANGTVACFNHAEERVCFLHFPELANGEREMFELLWRRAKEPVTQAQTVAVSLSMDPKPLVPLSTRSLSNLREFLLSRKSLALFGFCAMLAAGMTFGLWRHTYDLNLQRERERAMSIVATGAMQFNANDLDQLHTIDDIKRPEYAKVIKQLNEIRSKNERVAYAWIMRPIEGKSGYWEYVADADSLDPYAKIDANHDGVIDEKDELQYPGFPYEEFDSYFEEEMNGTFSTPDIHSDQYGTYFTTMAPIYGVSGNVVAAIGVDIMLNDVSLLTKKSSNYFPIFIGLFLLLVLIRLAAFNRSLFFELLKILNSKKVFIFLGVCTLLSLGITLGMYLYSYHLSLQRVREQVIAIASTAAPEFDTEDLDQLRTWRDAEKPVYKKVVAQLQNIRKRNSKVRYVYIMRATPDPYFYAFVADADSGDIRSWKDLNNDHLDNDQTAPGHLFFDPNADRSVLYMSFTAPIADSKPFTDEWGTWISGHAPIQDRQGDAKDIIGIDIDASEVASYSRQSFSPFLFFVTLLLLIILLRLVGLIRIRQHF